VLGASGNVEGEIVAKVARISGTLVGSIHATSVVLSATSQVTGEILNETLAVEAGAKLFEVRYKRISDKDVSAQTNVLAIDTVAE
jgi:cytoskeletal protein CcmA (bactofilin family)